MPLRSPQVVRLQTDRMYPKVGVVRQKYLCDHLKLNRNVMIFLTVLAFTSLLVICMDIEVNPGPRSTPQFTSIFITNPETFNFYITRINSMALSLESMLACRRGNKFRNSHVTNSNVTATDRAVFILSVEK